MSQREQIARIIDPDEWASLDRSRITHRGRIVTLTEAVMERHCKRSLIKADAILALQGSTAPPPVLNSGEGDATLATQPPPAQQGKAP